MTSISLQYPTNVNVTQVYTLVYGFICSHITVCIGTGLLGIVAKWIIFRKGGEPGWKSLIPIYSKYTEYKMFWSSFVYFLIILLPVFGIGLIAYGFEYNKTVFVTIGCLSFVLSQILRYLFYYKKAKFFNQNGGFAVGLYFLEYIFNLILAFDSNCKHIKHD